MQMGQLIRYIRPEKLLSNQVRNRGRGGSLE